MSTLAAGALALLLAIVLGYLIRQHAKQGGRNLMHAETARLLAAQQATGVKLELANTRLRASESRLAVTLHSIGDAVLTTDANARVQRLNPVAERLTGWLSDEAVGRDVSDVFHIVNKETRHAAAVPVVETLANGTIQGLANHTVLIARDGSECDIADSCAPIRDESDVIVGAVLVFRDVSAEYASTLALRDSAALIETVLDTVADGIITFRADDESIAKINPAAERIFGYTATELIGANFSQLIPELGREHLQSSLADYKPSDTARARGLGREVSGRCKDGSAVPVEIAVSEMTLGGQQYFTGIVRDITARKQTEAALREASALQNAIFNSANFSSIATDAQGVIQIFNVGAERMLGYVAADVLNTITPAAISDPQELIVRAQSLSDEFGTRIAPGFEALVFKASRGIEDIYELTYIRQDGSRLPAVVSVTALRDAQNAIIGYLLIGTDNTARKAVEAEQQKLNQRLRDQQFYTRSLIEAHIDALMTTDPAGIITDVNTQMESLTGCTRDELIGAPFKVHFTDPARAEAGIQRVLTEKTVTDYELTVQSRSGKQTVVSYNATTFYDRERTLQGVFAAARDVTEQKGVEEELKLARAAAESASRTKSDFLASMSHEIRTPMNAIMGIADLLARTPLSEEQGKYVQVFRRAGDNLLNLINDILDLSKVEASQLELERTGFSLTDLIEKVVEMVSIRSEEKGLSLTCDIATDVPVELIGDPTRLRQVLLNLLGNAIKFTETGAVSLCVKRDEDAAVPTALRFVVSDSGIGIAPDKIGRIFERFRQGDSSTTRRFGGSGLGLTISKRLVELMGGRIWAESDVNHGSVFSFAVPFEQWRDHAGSLVSPIDTEITTALPALRILLVEDSDDNRIITMAYMADTPHRVDIAENGAIACDRFAAAHYDVVLMDRQMPVMDGLTATRTIRAWERANGRPPTPIIALTASALKGDREMCLAAGCTSFLTKPIRQDVLLRAIRDRNLIASPIEAGPSVLRGESVPHVDDVIAARVPIFLQNRRKDVATMLSAIGRGDLPTVQRLGHNMRGTGAGYGFQAITDIGAAIELAAQKGNVDTTQHWVDALAAYLDTARPPTR